MFGARSPPRLLLVKFQTFWALIGYQWPQATPAASREPGRCCASMVKTINIFKSHIFVLISEVTWPVAGRDWVMTAIISTFFEEYERVDVTVRGINWFSLYGQFSRSDAWMMGVTDTRQMGESQHWHQTSPDSRWQMTPSLRSETAFYFDPVKI